MSETAVCNVCFRQCHIKEGEFGFCGARWNVKGEVKSYAYGRLTSMALDPIEKKPLRRFFPGTKILSIGSYGCNIRCPFCQNYSITWSKEAYAQSEKLQYFSPEDVLNIGLGLKEKGNIGIAFTYNEPLIAYEYVRDVAKLFHEHDMKCVLVSNGEARLPVLKEILPYIDAMNIDLKGFKKEYYRDVLKGDLAEVLSFIEEAVKHCHVELTTLIVPRENDSEEEMRQMTRWIASLQNGREVPLHISRFFPQFHMTDRKATDVDLIYRLAEIAREELHYVYTGNC